MKHVLIWLIRLYQKYLSPRKSAPTCRFVPTCSSYAIEALSKRGFFVGTGLTVWRILRCNPFCPGGYDPVPLRGFATMGRDSYVTDDNDTYPRACEDYVPPQKSAPSTTAEDEPSDPDGDRP